jgi:D-sedoheptulose 7-phosphate isomerase
VIQKYLSEIKQAIDNLDKEPIVELVATLKILKGCVYTMGNGGSASTASHLASDLAKSCGLNTLCLNDSIPYLTALANDEGYENVFARQLEKATRDDMVIAISCSGNSPNILRGVLRASLNMATTVGLIAFDGGKLKSLVNIPIVVPVNNFEISEDIHLMICHILKTCFGEAK